MWTNCEYEINFTECKLSEALLKRIYGRFCDSNYFWPDKHIRKVKPKRINSEICRADKLCLINNALFKNIICISITVYLEGIMKPVTETV